jgi:hypothetical protein
VKDVSEPERETAANGEVAQVPKAERPKVSEPSVIIRTRYDNKPASAVTEELPDAPSDV